MFYIKSKKFPILFNNSKKLCNEQTSTSTEITAELVIVNPFTLLALLLIMQIYIVHTHDEYVKLVESDNVLFLKFKKMHFFCQVSFASPGCNYSS